jgi:methanogenic corrinoid protein MtbC1
VTSAASANHPPVARLLELAADGHPRPAITLGLQLLAAGTPVERIIRDVLVPVQRQVGELWESNQWRTADEHAATAVVDGVLGALSLETAIPDAPRGTVVVACAEGEHHTLPARMGAEILRADGWEVTFLGGSLPADDLQRFTAQRVPDAVVISCTTPLVLGGARRCFTAIGELGLPAFAAGAAFGDNPGRALRLGAQGWLGQGMDLATLLADNSQVAEAIPAPREALALQLDHDALVESCLSLMVARIPAMATYSPAQLRSTRTDLTYILGFLAAAVDLDEDEIFENFLAWLAGVLGSRGVPAVVLDESLQCVGEVMETAGLQRAAQLCAAGMRAAAGPPSS